MRFWGLFGDKKNFCGACHYEIYGDPEYSYAGEVFCSDTCMEDYQGAQSLEQFVKEHEKHRKRERNEKIRENFGRSKEFLNEKHNEIEDRLEDRRRELGRK